MCCLSATAALAAAPPEALPWQKAYVGDQATGPDIIALWQFDPGAETVDSSGHGHDLTLRGESRFVAEGRFGGCLESFSAGEGNDKPQGAMAKNAPDLTPAGAFTLEAWFKPKPEMDKDTTVFLLDKKYFHYAKDLPEANHDYCLYLSRTGENRRRLIAFLGFGEDSAQFSSNEVEVEPGKWVHVAFTYDGEGTGRFFFNGQTVGRRTHEGRGAVSPGRYGLVLGCRYGSTHNGFPGLLDQVRISNGVVPFLTGSLEIGVGGARTAYLRMEQGAWAPVLLANDTGKPVTNGSVRVLFGGTERRVALPDLQPKAEYPVEVPVDTSVRPGTYALKLIASAKTGGKALEVEKEIPLTIVPRPLPNEMPVVMWGSGDYQRLKEIGFTHQLTHLADYGKVWAAAQPTEAAWSEGVEQYARSLDEALVQGVAGVVYLYPGRYLAQNKPLLEKYERVDRTGRPYGKDNICASFPEAQTFAYNVGASVAKSFASFPGLQASLVHSEIRDGTNLCFHDHDLAAFRAFAGYDIPKEAVSKGGVGYTTLPDFPRDRVVPDDDHLLTFYRWFWKSGDGWNDLHTQVHKGLKSTGRRDLWTFFDPAVRVPSVWGSGGGVDVISQWTYSYPDPLKIGQATDELFAMADGTPGQQVMKMTQVIWYRSGTAPKLPEDESKRAQWEQDIPDAQFITIAPDHLREAFWAKMSRPIRGIMYHGWGSLVDAGPGGYRYTNPKTKEVLAELIRSVVRPLGATLLQVPDRRADVALLESFASQVFAGRGTWGWSQSWEADAHLILQWAQLQPRILYDEAVLRDGLDGYRVLVLPSCDVLTEGVAAKIRAFQAKGGLIVADENACPAVMPDILLPSYKRTGKAQEDKAALQTMAADLRRELDAFYARYADSSNPDVVVRMRQYGGTDYLFAVNDNRTFGDYVGHHGKVMEQGLPSTATLSLSRKSGFAYDLLNHQPIAAKATPTGLALDVALGPGDGRVFMVTQQALAAVRVTAPSQVKLGGQAKVDVRVVDAAGKPLTAVVPVQVEILDAQGQPAELSGYYGARDGVLSVTLEIAANDPVGQWTVRATELASGRQSERKFAVVK